MQQWCIADEGLRCLCCRRWGLRVVKVEGEALHRLCPKTGRNPHTGSPIIPLGVFLSSYSECNTPLRKKLTCDLQPACLTLSDYSLR